MGHCPVGAARLLLLLTPWARLGPGIHGAGCWHLGPVVPGVEVPMSHSLQVHGKHGELPEERGTEAHAAQPAEGGSPPGWYGRVLVTSEFANTQGPGLRGDARVQAPPCWCALGTGLPPRHVSCATDVHEGNTAKPPAGLPGILWGESTARRGQ